MSLKLIHGDCLDYIHELSFDCIITDPPYGSTDIVFDKQPLSLKVFEELAKVAKPNSYLVSFGSVELLGDIAKIWKVRFSGVWLKQCPVIRTKAAKKPMSKMEMYTVYAHPNHKISKLVWNKQYNIGTPYKKIQNNTGAKREGNDSLVRASPCGWSQDGYIIDNNGTRQQCDVIEANNKVGMVKAERTKHPTQKPIKLMSVLINWLTNPNDIILDPFMGSGSTGAACQLLERNFIGIETNEDYFKMANDRLTHT